MGFRCALSRRPPLCRATEPSISLAFAPTLGANMTPTTTSKYLTRGGITVARRSTTTAAHEAIEGLIDRLDHSLGVLLSSSYEYPGRYTRWDLGFADPVLVVTASQRSVTVEAPSRRGIVLLGAVEAALASHPHVVGVVRREARITLSVIEPTEVFPEEQRSRQPSVFSVVRALMDLFGSDEDEHLGLYGAFGYDLAYQFESVPLRGPRPEDQRDLVLYLPDELLVVDHRTEHAEVRFYDFEVDGLRTGAMPRDGFTEPYVPDPNVVARSDHAPGEYARSVDLAKESFRRGDLFEVVPGQRFTEPCQHQPSELFRRLRERNPAPYGFIISLGQAEWLVGASPEMYVRVEGSRVETCPISGTIARGTDPISDAAQILALLNSEKDESELTMCTDVDRNDKSRICEPGSVRVLGRRQIELYSRLIHTVDHVEGHLRAGFDALDAFLTHTWAVTVTGAPKLWAMRWIEQHERTERAWYGGAIGRIGFDGRMNTGLTLRTIRLKDGAAQVRVGATLLFDSDPIAEEEETQLKASAFLDAIRSVGPVVRATGAEVPVVSAGRSVLFVDHEDSFVHTLAGYFRAAGASVKTVRSGSVAFAIAESKPDLIVLSPGPGCPTDFSVSRTIGLAMANEIPLFGVCLGLQGIVEHFGGTLGQLELPMHGKPSPITVTQESRFGLFDLIPATFEAGRYHSLFAEESTFPDELMISARSSDRVIMAIEHRTLPIAAVQFHPESIMSLGAGAGARLVANVVAQLS
jgi:anthranilate synthase